MKLKVSGESVEILQEVNPTEKKAEEESKKSEVKDKNSSSKHKTSSTEKIQNYKVKERMAQKACRFALNEIDLNTISANMPDVIEFHSVLKDAVQNLTTTEVQDVLKKWKVNEWPSVDLNTIESELKYSDASDMHEEHGDTVIDVKPVIEIMIKGTLMRALIDSGCERSVINEDLVKSNGWTYKKVSQALVLKMANGVKEPVFHSLHNISLASDDFSGRVDTLLLAPIKGYDIVLGRDFLRRYKARVLLNSKEGSMSSSKENSESSVTGVELWYENKEKYVLIPFDTRMKHVKSSYKDILMSREQLNKACDDGKKFYLYKIEKEEKAGVQYNDNCLDPIKEAKIKEEFAHIFRDVLPAKLPPHRGIVHHIYTIEWCTNFTTERI